MRQLQLFNTTELAAMRDRTKARNYSPERDNFRREHQRHRAWGSTRRHTRKLRHLQGGSHARPTPTPAGSRTEGEPPSGPRLAQHEQPKLPAVSLDRPVGPAL